MENKEVTISGHCLRFEPATEPDEFFTAKAAEELRETPERREQALRELKKLLQGQKELYVGLDEDHAFVGYLRVCKFYPESAFQRICNTYQMRNKYPKYASNLIPALQKTAFEHNLITVFPYRDQHGRRILLIEAGKKWNPKEVSLPELVRAVILLVDGAMMEPKTQVAGAIVILDMIGLSLQHVWQLSPSFARMFLHWVQECLPCRLKAVHIVNQPYVFDMAFAIFKPFIREKLRNRIFFHGEDRASLLEHVDAKVLPTQYGGSLELETNDGMKLHQLLSEYTEIYERGDAYGYNKKKS